MFVIILILLVLIVKFSPNIDYLKQDGKVIYVLWYTNFSDTRKYIKLFTRYL